jgi:hypothetical protein
MGVARPRRRGPPEALTEGCRCPKSARPQWWMRAGWASQVHGLFARHAEALGHGIKRRSPPPAVGARHSTLIPRSTLIPQGARGT